MKPITEYQDYRLYMQDYYDEKKRLSAFSWRDFSHAAGFSSPTYLKLVCEGKTYQVLSLDGEYQRNEIEILAQEVVQGAPAPSPSSSEL